MKRNGFVIRPQRAIAIAFLITFGLVVDVNLAKARDEIVPWEEIQKSASDFVEKESPRYVLPFQTGSSKSRRKVFIHYFPIWLLSLDNKPTDSDYWSANYKSVLGGQGQYVKSGGLFRERPITPPPWSSPYWQLRNLAIDILRARRIGADGFLLDLPAINEGKTWDIAVSLCNVAAHIAPGFKIAFEPGMASLKSKVDPAALAHALLELNRCAAAYHVEDGRLLISPFATEFEPVEFWQNVLGLMSASGTKAALLPVFLDPTKFALAFHEISYGVSYWGVGDADSVEGQPEKKLYSLLSSAFGVLMLPVRPQDVRPNRLMFWEAQNTNLYRRMWAKAIRSSAQYVQIITWNDLSEGTEIEPASATQFVFYDLSAYYIYWFKNGTPPKIISDTIYYSSRDQIVTPEHTVGPDQKPMKVMGKTSVSNNIEMVAFLTAPSTLEIEIGGRIYRKPNEPGMAVFTVPAKYGRPVFRIIRGAKIVAEITAHYTISETLNRENPLYYGGSSNRKVVE